MVTLEFQLGTLVLDGPAAELEPLSDYCVEDARIGRHRAPANNYAAIVTHLHRSQAPFRDLAREWQELPLEFDPGMQPRPYQTAALAAWTQQQRRGVVVLPTGSGKSFLAQMAIAATRRPTLVVAPTIDLMQQWAGQLERAFACPVGMLGGGSKELLDLTVSTYDSAALHMEFIGNRYGFLIVDECHHLPGRTSRQVATMCLAPFRLGLTATPERQDDGEELIYELMGPLCYRRDIDEMEGKFLSPYRTERLEFELETDERERYESSRQLYTDFVRRNGINFSSPGGWARFLALCGRLPDGREALNAYLEQKRIARASRAKFNALWELFGQHAGERILVFTADNDTAYAIGRRFFLPVLTHHTKAKERKEFLDAFRAATYPVLVTSKVLNEGIDVPEASVGIVVSGSGSTREHVQRLGRILRPIHGKQATLYELVSVGTSESYVSQRRRQHRAYQRHA